MKLKNNMPELVEGQSLAKLARDIDTSNQTVQVYAGKEAPEYFTEDTRVIGVLIRMANRLGVKFSDLFGVIEE